MAHSGFPPAQADKYERFKRLHTRLGLFIIPNPWDAGSARILTALGFEALATTSAGLAFSLGRRDMGGGLTRSHVLENARAIVEATHLPVSADLQDGFGNAPDECAATIRLASETGLAGGSIEDSTGDPRSPIYDLEHAVERVRAACETARSLQFVLTARAENFLWGRSDLDDTIRRLTAYSSAGADVLYAPGLPDLDSIRAVCSSVDKPVNVVMGLQGAPLTLEQLREAGVKRVSVGGSFARAALGALVRAAREVQEHGTFTYASHALSHAEASTFMRTADEL
jgi:2-methylisocitrate lyase-like PEP mutase family enzyme